MEYNGVEISDMTDIGPIHHMTTSDPCFHIGIAGNCGMDCPVYLNGACGEPSGNLEYETRPDILASYKTVLDGDNLENAVTQIADTHHKAPLN